MPIQVDSSKPVKTVDSSGKTVSTSTNEAAPIKSLDTQGRSVQREVKTEANSIADRAAKEAGFAPSENNPPLAEDKITESKIRKEYLEAQRIKRSAQEMEKKAKTNLSRAQAFEKAREMAENGDDPTAILRSAGLDPVKYYRDLTNYALSDKGKKEEVDPVKRELSEHKERLDKYAKDLEEQSKAIQSKEEVAAHNQVIQDKVIPMLRDNGDKYETILAQYGNQAAVEVYKNVWDIYQQTGEAKTFESVADEMEKYWSEQVESGIIKALQLKKFKEKYTQSSSQNSGNYRSERQETPNSSITLSNKQIVSTPKSSNPFKGMTKEERVAAIIRKFE